MELFRRSFGWIFNPSASESAMRNDGEPPKEFQVKTPTLEEDLRHLSPDQAAGILGRRPHLGAMPPGALEVVGPPPSANEQDEHRNENSTPVTQHLVYLDFAEHFHVADSLTLPGITSLHETSKDRPLLLPNGLCLTYGRINALAGDFFSTATPISDPNSFQLQKVQFQKAFETLANGDPKKATALLEVLQVEVDKVDYAIKHGLDVIKVYEELGDRLAKLQFASEHGQQPVGEDYVSLLMKNRDHFYPDHRTAYNVGHAKAIEVASSGKQEDLAKAYAMNAFADHFLQDAFASGHLRVPRVKMMNTNIFTNILANFMHNEDNLYGLKVQTPGDNPTRWRCYGDSMMFTRDGVPTYKQVQNAVGASIREVWEAHNNAKEGLQKLLPDPESFSAWSFCVDEDRIMSQENHCPMFILHDSGDIWQRKDLDKTAGKPPPLQWAFEPVWDHNSLGYSILKHLPKATLDYLYFGVLAFKCSPVGEIKHFILQRIELCLLEAGLRQKLVDHIMKILGFF